MMVPDIPEEVEMKMKREHYMAKEALAENQVQENGFCTVSVSLTQMVSVTLWFVPLLGFVLPDFRENHDSR